MNLSTLMLFIKTYLVVKIRIYANCLFYFIERVCMRSCVCIALYRKVLRLYVRVCVYMYICICKNVKANAQIYILLL